MNGIVFGAEDAGDLVHQLVGAITEYDLVRVEIFEFSEGVP